MCSFLLLYLSVSTYLPLQVFISLFSLLYLFVFIYLYLLHFIYSFLPLYSTCVSSYIFLYSFLNALGISLYAHLSLSLSPETVLQNILSFYMFRFPPTICFVISNFFLQLCSNFFQSQSINFQVLVSSSCPSTLMLRVQTLIVVTPLFLIY